MIRDTEESVAGRTRQKPVYCLPAQGSLSTCDTRVWFCLLYTSTGPHYCILANSSQGSTRLRLTERPGRAAGSAHRGMTQGPEAWERPVASVSYRLPLMVRDLVGSRPGFSGAR